MNHLQNALHNLYGGRSHYTFDEEPELAAAERAQEEPRAGNLLLVKSPRKRYVRVPVCTDDHESVGMLLYKSHHAPEGLSVLRGGIVQRHDDGTFSRSYVARQPCQLLLDGLCHAA